jgi:hypothetical protein
MPPEVAVILVLPEDQADGTTTTITSFVTWASPEPRPKYRLAVSEKLPSFREFHRRIWAGEVNLADNDLQIVYGMVHWEQLLQNMRQTRFEETLRIVSDRHGCSEGMRQPLPLAQ